MGTTRTSFASTDAGVRYCYVLAIEGYQYLLTDHETPSNLFTASYGWNGTEWTQALGGLRVEGKIHQSITPWSDKIEVNTLTFYIQNDHGSDQFGVDTHKWKAGNETYLNEADFVLEPDDTTITVKDTSNFAATGHIYIGAETIEYVSKAATSFTATSGGNSLRGKWSPFAADTAPAFRMARNHKQAEATYDTPLPITVSDAIRHWAGRRVGLFVHRIQTSTNVDLKSQAELVFAGKIKEKGDTATGETMLVCEDIRSEIRDCVLLRDQFIGKVAEGVYLAGGTQFDAQVGYNLLAGSPVISSAAALKVEDSPAAGELQSGFWLAEDLMSAIQDWLQNDATIGQGAAFTDSFSVRLNSDNLVEFTWDSNGSYIQLGFKLRAANHVWRFLGWNRSSVGYGWVGPGDRSGNSITVTSEDVPHRIMAYQRFADGLDLDSSQGTWVNNADWLPSGIDDPVSSGEDWGLLQIGSGDVVLCKHSDDTTFTDVRSTDGLRRLLGVDDRPTAAGLKIGEDGDLEVRQIVVLQGTLLDLVTRFFACTGADAYNHATYDDGDFGAQLGAGIPWALLDDGFTDSLSSLMESEAPSSIIVRLEKSTPLQEVLAPELLLRNAHLIFKDGGLQFTSTQTPNIQLSQHTLTENNKGVGGNADDPDRTVTEETSEHARNVIELQYNADLTGTFRNHVTIRDHLSISMIGERKVTIKCRNSFGGYSQTGNVVAKLAGAIAAHVLPVWGRPMRRMSRSISRPLWFGVYPGEQASVTDSYARDWDTGARGITGRACVILSHEYDLGDGGDHRREASGGVTLAFTDLDVGLYAPSAHVDDTATGGGYEADTDIDGAAQPGNSRLTFYAHEHSESSEATDVASFAASDTVRILQIDPSGAARTWTATLVAVDATDNQAELDTNLAGFLSTERYRMIPRNYSSAVTRQTGLFSWQADDADARIENLRGPYDWGDYDSSAYTDAASTELPERHSSQQYGDGAPVATGTHRAIARFVDNFIDYKSARQCPTSMVDYDSGGGPSWTPYYQGSSGANWDWLFTQPYHIGAGSLDGRSRLLSIAVGLAASGGGGADTVECRVTISLRPPTGSTRTNVTFSQPYLQLTYSTASTSYTITAAQTVKTISNPWAGWGYLSVEVRGSGSHGSLPRFYGMNENRLGPVT